MTPLRWILVLAAAAGLAWAVASMLPGDPQDAPASGAAGGPDAVAAPAARGPQIELLGGPPTRDAESAVRSMGNLERDSTLRAEQRRERLREVLGNLENSAVWVEGVDGADSAAGRPPQPAPR